MNNHYILTLDTVECFRAFLIREEKADVTVEKYVRDVKKLIDFLKETPITKESIMDFKKELISQGYAVRSINSILASINSLLSFLELESCKVKNMRTQHKVYCDAERELNKKEYFRLVKAASNNPRLEVILQTICATGIRISELAYFTVEAVKQGEIHVSCKNKTRSILIPGKLKKMLLRYSRKNGISNGIIFRTKGGKTVNRSNIWREMKNLCEKAGVMMSKVFPHNLRKLFAKAFYNVEKDIAKLADVLGHSSINTTRIYIMTSGWEHRRQIESLGLVIGEDIKITT